MNATWIVTVFVMTDDLLTVLKHRSHVLAQVPDSEIITVALVAAKYFQNHQERAFEMMRDLGYLSGELSYSRFNRRLHALAEWVEFLSVTVGESFAHGELFVIDSMPIPVCRRVRARRCRKVRGRAYCGYCAAKKEKFFGWRLHLICTSAGQPVSFQLVPASCHDLTAVHELAFVLPPGARLLGDKAFNSALDEASLLTETQVQLIPIRKDNMTPHAWAEDYDLRTHRHTIETRNSQLESMGLERLRARTNRGLELKVHASLIALAWTNAN